MSVENDDMESIEIAESAWNQRQLLATIIARHFAIKEELGGLWPAWIVYPIVDVGDEGEVDNEDDEANEVGKGDVHADLQLLNDHLAELDWMAELKIDDPWVLKIKPRPIRQFGTSKFTQLFFWFGSLVSTIIVGTAWVSPRFDDVSWYSQDVLLPVILYYSLPFMIVIALASIFQQLIAERLGMRVGGILPVMFPFPYLAWPFGIISLPSSPRMDDISWRDRHRIGIISLISPAFLLISGMVMVIVGLYLTPQNTSLFAKPTAVEFSLLPETLGIIFLGAEEYALASAWPHPLALAGHGLMLIGWISLLPFPGLPGNRILISEMGMSATRSTGTQIVLFIAICLSGLMFGAFSGHQMWTFLTILGAMSILMNGADQHTPQILDDIKEFSSSSNLKLTHVIFLSLLLALPAEFPTVEAEDWDAELDWEFPSVSRIDANATNNVSLVVTSKALVSHHWTIQGWHSSDGWELSWNCQGKILPLSEKCSGTAEPLQRTEIILVATPPEDKSGLTGITVHLWYEDESDGNYSTISLQPMVPISTKTNYWSWDGNHIAPRICADVIIDDSAPKGNMTLKSADGTGNQLWQFDNNSRIVIDSKASKTEMEMCATGVNGAIHLMQNAENQSELIPALDWVGDDGSTWLATLSLPLSNSKLISNSSPLEISAPNPLFTSGDNLFAGQENSTCDLDATPRLPAGNNSTWDWNLGLRQQGLLPELENGVISLTLPENGWLHWCQDSVIPSQSWQIETLNNPRLAGTIWDGKMIGVWFSSAENSSNKTWQLPLNDTQVRFYGDGNIDAEIDGDVVNISIASSGQEYRANVVWIDVGNDGKVLCNIASWSLGD